MKFKFNWASVFPFAKSGKLNLGALRRIENILFPIVLGNGGLISLDSTLKCKLSNN